MRPARIVSGGQTGVDRGGLDAAIALGIDHGGWCPRGRRAEDGTIPERYQLREATSADYARRTEANVVDSDGTLIVARGPLGGGSALTADCARKHGRPLLVLDVATTEAGEAVAMIRAFVADYAIATLNVAGPRGSKAPELRQVVTDLLVDAFA